MASGRVSDAREDGSSRGDVAVGCGWGPLARAADKPDDEAAVKAHIKALADTDPDNRAKAAEALRRIVAKSPSGTTYLATKDGGEAAWREKLGKVTLGMAKADVLKLPPFADASESSVMTFSDRYLVSYRLDYHWTVWITYRNTDKVIGEPALFKRALRVNVPAPKDFTGTWTTWHVNGQKGFEVQYKNGEYDGTFTSFHDNGTKSHEQHYVKGEADGAHTGWFYDGQMQYTMVYKNGKLHGVWTHWHSNGNKQREEHYADGQPHGRSTYWHENGRLASITDYAFGERHGREASWNEKGELQYDRMLENGKVVESK